MTDLFKLILGILASRFKARATLEAENLVLRQQVNVLRRRTPKRPHLNNTDRFLFVWLYRWFPSVLEAVAIVRPETIIRWHRCAVQRRRFPMGASPIRQPLQPEAIGAVMEVTKWLKPSISVSQIGDSASVQAESAISGLMRCSKSVNRILFNHINRCREQRLRNSESEAFRGPPVRCQGLVDRIG